MYHCAMYTSLRKQQYNLESIGQNWRYIMKIKMKWRSCLCLHIRWFECLSLLNSEKWKLIHFHCSFITHLETILRSLLRRSFRWLFRFNLKVFGDHFNSIARFTHRSNQTDCQQHVFTFFGNRNLVYFGTVWRWFSFWLVQSHWINEFLKPLSLVFSTRVLAMQYFHFAVNRNRVSVILRDSNFSFNFIRFALALSLFLFILIIFLFFLYLLQKRSDTFD